MSAMRALSLTQPWATLIDIGAKRIETRDWGTKYRGPLVIQSSKGFPRDCKELCYERPFADVLNAAGVQEVGDLLCGYLLCVVDLVDCVAITEANTPTGNEYAFGHYGPGRFAWRVENVRRLKAPIQCKGALGIWMVPPAIAAEVARGCL